MNQKINNSFKRYEFFDVDTISQSLGASHDDSSCSAYADSGVILLGDRHGNLSVIDTLNFNGIDFEKSTYKLFKGEIKGLAYFMDSASGLNKRMVIAIGDENFRVSDKENTNYFIKVTLSC